MKRSHILGTTAVALTMLSGIGYASVAAAADDTALPEIVVKARARSEKLLEVPISVQSFSSARLAEDNVVNLDTLQAEAGFTFNSSQASYGGGGRQYPDLTFRGLWSNTGGSLGGSSGALFVDGIYISGGAASVTLADASSVEVLKGPQNVYFGKNTFGGAVNLITSNPSEAYHAKATVGYSAKGSYDDVFSAEGAIIPGLLTGRVTGELFHQGAQYTSYQGGPLGVQDTKGVTVVLYATPTPDIWLRTRVHYSVDNDSAAAEGDVDGYVYGSTCPGVAAPYFCNGIPTLATLHPNQVLTGSNIDAAELNYIKTNNWYGIGAQERWAGKAPKVDNYGLARDNFQASAAGGVKLPYDTTLQFSAGYNGSESDDAIQADHTQSLIFDSNVVTITRDFSGDVRLITSASRPWRAVLGLNYFSSVNQVSSATSVYDNTFDQTEAAYGSLEYDILSNLTLTGEVRYQRDVVADNIGPGASASQAFNETLPRVLLSYKPVKGTNLYLSYSEGVQPPQLNGSYLQAEAAKQLNGQSYYLNALAGFGETSAFSKDPKVRVTEIGWKQSLFDNRLNFSIDYYNEFWDNALVTNYDFNPSTCGPTTPAYPSNQSAACPYSSAGASIIALSQNHIQGIEFDANAKFSSKLTGHAAFNWTDGHRTSYAETDTGPMFTSGVTPNENGNRIDGVPQFQAEGDLTYKDHLVGPYDWFAHGNLTYTGPQYIDPTDVGVMNGFYRVNASVGVVKGNLTFEVYVKNLLDDRNWDAAYRFPDPYLHSLGTPPTFYEFNYQIMSAIVTAPNPRDFGFKLSVKY
jgi:iron complex outermembrane receptor protein